MFQKKNVCVDDKYKLRKFNETSLKKKLMVILNKQRQ